MKCVAQATTSESLFEYQMGGARPQPLLRELTSDFSPRCERRVDVDVKLLRVLSDVFDQILVDVDTDGVVGGCDQQIDHDRTVHASRSGMNVSRHDGADVPAGLDVNTHLALTLIEGHLRHARRRGDGWWDLVCGREVRRKRTAASKGGNSHENGRC